MKCGQMKSDGRRELQRFHDREEQEPNQRLWGVEAYLLLKKKCTGGRALWSAARQESSRRCVQLRHATRGAVFLGGIRLSGSPPYFLLPPGLFSSYTLPSRVRCCSSMCAVQLSRTSELARRLDLPRTHRHLGHWET